jgi:glucose/mannose transport system substrate-binding protein
MFTYKIKYLAVFNLLLIGVFAITACGPAATPTPEPTQPPVVPPDVEPPPDELTGQMEVFSWWTTGGEAAGLENMFELYSNKFPQVEIINATVAGGAGFEAKPALTARMLGGDPPDSFQVHMGQELTETWVVGGFMEPVTFIFQQEGWEEVYPQGVLDIISYEGEYWTVPVNIHRANVLWYNRQLFDQYGWTPPSTFDEFFALAEDMQANGITPLALGDVGIWASTHLFEVVLAGSMSPEKYNGLWTGETDWNGPEVQLALERMARMLEYANPDHSALSWDQANDLVIQGRAGMTIMGDWVDADNLAKGFEHSGWALPPGTDGIFVALSDTFCLPQNAPHRENAIEWLRVVGSKEGQEAFNPVKGSICARSDCDPNLFGPYLQGAMQDWENHSIVPSLAHGAAAPEAWVALINDVMTTFVTTLDVSSAQSGLAQSCIDAGICQ